MDRLPLTDASHVASARRHAVQLAAATGLDEVDTGRVALVVTELANNLLRHGGGGEMLFGLDRATPAGVEILALDRGRGMANVGECLRDGYSTAGTPGTGLGAVQRVADEMDIYSRPQHGTTVLARLHRRRDPAVAERRLSIVTVPKSGETMCGDAAAMVTGPDGRTGLLMADGLGHGELAAAAAQEALRLFRARWLGEPMAVLEALHAGLRHTRGAAVAVAFIDPARGTVTYGGIGNIAGLLSDPSGTRRMVSHNGTIGHGMWKGQAYTYSFAGVPLLVMHSDGLATSWSLDAHPGLLRHDPAAIAATLYREHARGRDDCGVLVWRG